MVKITFVGGKSRKYPSADRDNGMAGKSADLQKPVLSTGDLASICHVTKHTIISAIERGELRASRTPGGHNRIRREDALAFMSRHDVISEPTHETILVVDPDSFVFDLVRQMLSEEQLRVVHAKSVFAAGVLAEREHPQVILFEAGIIGLQPADFLDATFLKGTASVPRLIAIASAQATGDGSIQELHAAGIENILEKPFGIDKLRAIIKENSTEGKI